MQLCGSLSTLWHCYLWDWNENRSFPVLWPLLSFPHLLSDWITTKKRKRRRVVFCYTMLRWGIDSGWVWGHGWERLAGWWGSGTRGTMGSLRASLRNIGNHVSKADSYLFSRTGSAPGNMVSVGSARKSLFPGDFQKSLLNSRWCYILKICKS